MNNNEFIAELQEIANATDRHYSWVTVAQVLHRTYLYGTGVLEMGAVVTQHGMLYMSN